MLLSLLGITFASALLGTPIFIIMGLLAVILFFFNGIEISAVSVEIFRIASQPSILSIPLFTFAGYLMAESQSPKRLLKLSEACFGWMPGGIAIVSLIVCAFFTAFTGASGVTIIALGGLIYPILLKDGYSQKFSLGLVTSTGSLGLLFPPSLPIILYGLVAKVDIDKLFLAGILPGVLLIIALSLWSIYNYQFKNTLHSKVQGESSHERHRKTELSFKGIWEAFREGYLEALLPIIILVGIYGGFTTVTEAAAICALYVFIMEVFIYKDLKLTKDVPRIVQEASGLVGGILLILCCALGFTNYLVDEEIPMKILEVMKLYLHDKYSFLFFLNIFLLIVGCLMDIFSAIIVVVPIIIPVAKEFGVDPIHLGIIFLTNLEIGYLTPPVGINLFLSSFRFQLPITTLYRAAIPYIIILLVCLAIITYFPALSLFLT